MQRRLGSVLIGGESLDSGSPIWATLVVKSPSSTSSRVSVEEGDGSDEGRWAWEAESEVQRKNAIPTVTLL